MYYYSYETRNKVNNKIYNGVHQTENLDDGYIGSGKLLWRAIEKYGIENFEKSILEFFDTKEEMFAREAEVVNEDFVRRKDTYNITVGGKGGFWYINQTGIGDKQEAGRLGGITSSIKGVNKNRVKSFQTRSRQGLSIKNAWETKRFNGFSNYAHSDETKAMMSGPREKSVGEKNSQYGTMWITDGIENKKIKKTDAIPLGWISGRTYKKHQNLRL